MLKKENRQEDRRVASIDWEVVVYLGIGIVMCIAFILILTSDSRLGGVDREVMEVGESIVNESSRVEGYSELGVHVGSDGKISVENWRLAELAEAYEEQNDLEYIVGVEDKPTQEGDWLNTDVESEDFKFNFRVYGGETIVVDLKLTDSSDPYILAPRGSVLNGVVKDKTLFRVKEVEKGLFRLEAKEEDFGRLEKFGLNLGNINSIAWLMTAVNIEDGTSRDFILASGFPEAEVWEGIEVGEDYRGAGGLLMWTVEYGDMRYLSIFNGSTVKVDGEVQIEGKGEFIGDTYVLDVSSGELSYIALGYNIDSVEVSLEGEEIYSTDK